MKIKPYIYQVVLIIIIANSCKTENKLENQSNTSSKIETNSDKNKCQNILDHIRSIKADTFEKNNRIPNDFDDSLLLLDTLINDDLKKWIQCLPDKEFGNRVHHRFGMYLRNNWGLWGNSELVKFFRKKNINHPDDMSGIILTSYQRKLKGEKINLEEQIDYFLNYWKEIEEVEKRKELELEQRRERNQKWLNNNRELVRKLPKIDPKEIVYLCDSIPIIKRIKKDTQTYWVIQSEAYYDAKEIIFRVNNDGLGVFQYIKGLNYQNNITIASLSPETFIRKQDSLFFQRIRGNKFELIFHPKIFSTSTSYPNEKSLDRIELLNVWKVKKKLFFEVGKVKNGRKYKWKFLFDENYKILNYNGCTKKEILGLTDKRRIKFENNR